MHDTVNMTLQILVILFCATQAAARGLRDGLIISRNAGWTSFHVLGWMTTDTLRIGLCVAALAHGDILIAVAILSTGLLHQPCYTFALRHPQYFAGPQHPPAWFTALRRFWSWLPGQRPVLRNTEDATQAMRRGVPFTLVIPTHLTQKAVDALIEQCDDRNTLDANHYPTYSVIVYQPHRSYDPYGTSYDI